MNMNNMLICELAMIFVQHPVLMTTLVKFLGIWRRPGSLPFRTPYNTRVWVDEHD